MGTSRGQKRGLESGHGQGATLAELKGIAGHKSVAAVMRYQHSTLERHAALAGAVSKAIADAV
ncbi:MAG TPA: hypothetical protein VIC86_08015 [Acidimicrobiales bacterium]